MRDYIPEPTMMSTRPRADSGAAWTNGIPEAGSLLKKQEAVGMHPAASAYRPVRASSPVVLVHGQRPERIPFVDEEE